MKWSPIFMYNVDIIKNCTLVIKHFQDKKIKEVKKNKEANKEREI